MLTGLTGLWCVCFVVHLGQVVGGRLAWIPLHVAAAAAPDAFPTVAGLWPDEAWSPSDLARGDRILSVGGQSLAGAEPLGFVLAVYDHAQEGTVALERERDGVAATVSLGLVRIDHAWRKSLVGAAFALVSALAFWRTRGSRPGRAFYFAGTAYAFHWIDFWAGRRPHRRGHRLVRDLEHPGLAAHAAHRAGVPEESAPRGACRSGPGCSPRRTGGPAGVRVPGFGAANEVTLALQVAAIAVLGARCRATARAGRSAGASSRVLVGSGGSPAGSRAWRPPCPRCGGCTSSRSCSRSRCRSALFIALARFNLLDVDRLITRAAISPVIGSGPSPWPRARDGVGRPAWVDPEVSQPALSIAIGGARSRSCAGSIAPRTAYTRSGASSRSSAAPAPRAGRVRGAEVLSLLASGSPRSCSW
jgi:hypothetical protein